MDQIRTQRYSFSVDSVKAPEQQAVVSQESHSIPNTLTCPRVRLTSFLSLSLRKLTSLERSFRVSQDGSHPGLSVGALHINRAGSDEIAHRSWEHNWRVMALSQTTLANKAGDVCLIYYDKNWFTWSRKDALLISASKESAVGSVVDWQPPAAAPLNPPLPSQPGHPSPMMAPSNDWAWWVLVPTHSCTTWDSPKGQPLLRDSPSAWPKLS